MTGRLILVRHGQTVANVAKELDTRPPGAALTPAGEQQALALAERFSTAGGRPAVLASSVALRARQTATPVSVTTETRLTVVEGLHEVQAGDLEGRSDDAAHKVFVDVFRHWYKGDLDERIPGGESGRDALARYLPQIDELRASYLTERSERAGNGDVVVVSHGAIIRLAVTAMTDVDPAFAVTNHLNNTDAVILTPQPGGGWGLERWGEKTPPFIGPDTGGADDPMG